MRGKGVRGPGGGPAVRHKGDNTRLSSNIVVKKCLEVIGADTELVKAGFEHIAGASEEGLGNKEKEERGIPNRDTRKGGKGSSFPDKIGRAPCRARVWQTV